MSRARQKVLVVIGTRPEAIKMAPVIHALKRRDDCRAIVCLTGQHREMIEQQLPGLRIRADYELRLMRANQDLGDLTERILVRLGAIITRTRPDWVLVQGDSTTAMAASLAAFCHGVRVAHVEAGLRTGDESDPLPEEVNRRIADALAALHFAPTEAAKTNLLREGVDPRTVVVTGNPVIDTLLHIAAQGPRYVRSISRLPFAHKRVIVFTMHRRESLGKPLEKMCAVVRQIAESTPDVHIACLVHRNPRVASVLRASFRGCRQITLLPPLAYRDFVELLRHSYFVITDSGGLQEECPSLGKPVIILRDKTERVEAVQSGAAVLAGKNPRHIRRVIAALLEDDNRVHRMAEVRHLYGDGHAASRIVRTLFR
jgi:UDP-N-acetylglucosamine 2-epimerase (non-hydrolysing)